VVQFRIVGRLFLVTLIMKLGAAKAEMPRGSHALGAGSLPCSAWIVARDDAEAPTSHAG